MKQQKKQAVLFDLDGTLIDTCPDLGFALNQLRGFYNLPPLSLSEIRPVIPDGVAGLIKLSFNISENDDKFYKLRDKFLSLYQEHLCVDSKLFVGIERIINWIENNNILWGIVTNKATIYTKAIIKTLQLKPSCCICGDTLANRKPSPDTLLYAAKQIDTPVNKLIYVGDSIKDMQAAKSACIDSLYVSYDTFDENLVQLANFHASTTEELLSILYRE